MRKLLEIVAVVALLNIAGTEALADGPAVSAQPDVSRQGTSVLGFAGLPSTAAEPTSLALFGAVLAATGLLLLWEGRRRSA